MIQGLSIQLSFILILVSTNCYLHAQETMVNAVIKVTNKCPFPIWSHGFASVRGTPTPILIHGGAVEEMNTGDVIVYDNLSTMGGGRMYAYYKQPPTSTLTQAEAIGFGYNQFIEFTIDPNAMNYNISYVDHASLPVSVRAIKNDPALGLCDETAANYCWNEWRSLLDICPTTLTYEYNGIGSCISSYEYCLYYGGSTDYCNKMKAYQYLSLDGEILTFDGYRIYGGDFDATTKWKIYRGDESSPQALAFWNQVAAWNRGTFAGDYNEANYYNDPQTKNGSWFKPYNEYAKWIHEDIGTQTYSFSTDDHQEKSGFVQCHDSKVLEVVWCPCTILPVELLSFEGKKENNYAKLIWSTGSEMNNDFFLIEKSIDGKTFKEFAKIKGKGNSIETVNYIAKDFHPLRGINYYRLKQVDLNGKQSYSSIVSVNFDERKFSIYPNPASSLLHIKFQEVSVSQLYVEDVLGRKLSEAEVPANLNEVNLDISSFPSGSYIIKLLSEDGEIIIERFIKQ